MRRIIQSRLLLSTLRRPISTSSSAAPPPPPPPPKPSRPLILPRRRSPTETQFESWITKLKPGFTPSDVDQALQAQSDPDLALDIFRWTAQRPTYNHNHQTYHTILQISISGRRFKAVRPIVEEVLAGACAPHPDLYNSIITFCCTERGLLKHAYTAYKKMLASKDCKPNLETYHVLLDNLLKKFSRKFPVNYVHLNSVQLLASQMKACGVVPDLCVLNMIIAAHSKCKLVAEAMRLFRELRLYGCEPDSYSYNLVMRAMCEAERVKAAWDLFKEMKEKGFIPSRRGYMVLVCSLAMDRRLDNAIEVMFDMMDNSIFPDLLTYSTLLEEMCRDNRGNEAHDLVEQFKKRDVCMDTRIYSSLLETLQMASQ